MAKQTISVHPNPKAQIAIATDASDLAMGANLEQRLGSEWQPLAYFSWKPSQKKYAYYDKKLVAIVESV